MNEEIRVPQVRLIGEEGGQLGIVDIKEAQRLAREAELDLVEISPTAAPPVCRIMDYGKYKYQQQKKVHDQKKKTQASEIRQLRIKTFRIDPHDLGIKLRKARAFIESGSRLMVNLMFRSREHSHADLGEQLLMQQLAKPLEDVAKVEAAPRKDGRRMTMTLAPLPNLKKILSQRLAKEEAERRAAEREGIKLPEREAPPALEDLLDDDDELDDEDDFADEAEGQVEGEVESGEVEAGK